MIEIPDHKRFKAMFLFNGEWAAIYYENGVQKRKKLGTDDPATAIKLRDSFFRALKKAGAVPKRKMSRDAKISKNPRRYITVRKPFVVKIGTALIGEFSTLREAKDGRDAWLAANRHE